MSESGLALISPRSSAGAGRAASRGTGERDAEAWSAIREDGDKAAGLFEHCRGQIFGQDHALGPLCEHVWAAEAGLIEPSRRPQGVYLSFGPTGTGKTETAKQTAWYLFGGEPAILPLNQFGDANSSDAFKDALARKILAKNHCGHVLLLDEIEKASRDVTDNLLSVFDEGRLLLPDGSYLEFADYHIYAASNIGSENLYNMGVTDDPAALLTMQDSVFNLAASILRPELFARADKKVFYAPLTDAVQRQILRYHLTKKVDWISKRLRGAKIVVEDSAVSALVGSGFHDQKEGARRVRTIVGEGVHNAVYRARREMPAPPLLLQGVQLPGEKESLQLVSAAAAMFGLGGLRGAALDL